MSQWNVSLIEDFIHKRILIQREGRWTFDGEAQNVVEGVPETLRAFILRRFGALASDERLILEAASVVGVEFTGAVIASALEQTTGDIDRQCELLAANGQFIEAVGLENWPDGTLTGRYRFQHPLYLEVLYDQIGDARKAELHQHIGDRLEIGYGDRTNEIAAALANHFDRGHDPDRTIRYGRIAAEQALNRHAYPEAIAVLTLVLDTLKQLPETPERGQRELGCLLMLGPCLVAVEGYTAPEVEQTFKRAEELCKQFGDDSNRAAVLWNLAGFRMARGELVQSRHLIEQFIELANTSTEDHMDVVVHDALAQQLFFEGELAPAHVQCEYVLSRYDFNQHRDLAKVYSQEDPGVVCSSFDAIILWLLGFPDQSLDRMQTCMKLSKQLENPHSSGFGMFLVGVMYQLRHDPVATQKQADDLIQIAADHALPWISLGKILRGWATVRQTADVEGLALLKSSLDTWRASGAGVIVPYCLGLLAATHQALGQISDASRSVAEALSMVETTHSRWYEAELHRLHGELALEQDGKQEVDAEQCFARAIEVARRQGARSLELRTALSLCRIWARQGQSDKARTMLEPIYTSFSEPPRTLDPQNYPLAVCIDTDSRMYNR